MGIIKIKISSDFHIAPGPRFIGEGSHSGEEFRETILEPKYKEAAQKGLKLVIDLDGTMGYGTSFLEESFGGLARIHDPKKILEVIQLVSVEEPYLVSDIKSYIKNAK